MAGEAYRIAVVYVHILAAIIWVGGTVFLAVVLVPLSRQFQQPPGAGARLLRLAARRFSRVGWAMLVVLGLSGVGELERLGLLARLDEAAFWSTELGRVLLVKGALVLAVVLLSAYHDFVLGPRVADLLEGLAPGKRPPPAAARLRRRLVNLARVNLLLSLAIVALAVMLVRGVPG